MTTRECFPIATPKGLQFNAYVLVARRISEKCATERTSPKGSFSRQRTVPFFVPPKSKASTPGSNCAYLRSAYSAAKNRRHSDQSYSMSIVFGRSLNQRVGGSSSPRFTKTFAQSQARFLVWMISASFFPRIEN